MPRDVRSTERTVSPRDRCRGPGRLKADAERLRDVFELYGRANMFEVYPGTHTSKVVDRFQNHVLPFLSRTLCAGKECR